MDIEERFKNIEERFKKIEERLGALNFPIDLNSQGAIEFVLFKVLQAQKFRGGWPIFTATRTDKLMQGEIWLYDISGTRQICGHISGTPFCVTIT